MLAFDATIHRRPVDCRTGASLLLAGEQSVTLDISHEALSSAAFDCSFEAAAAALDKLDRMFIEPDGAFVWVSPDGADSPWQIDGNLYDKDQKLRFVDIKGRCPAAQFDQLLAAFGWPATEVMFQLTRQAVLLDEQQFRRYAEQASAPDATS